MELEMSRAELSELSREILAALLASAPAAGGDFAEARRSGGWSFASGGFAASALLKGASTAAVAPESAPREFLSLLREPGGAVFAGGKAVSARERAAFGEGGGVRTAHAASVGGAASIGERARLLEDYSERIRRDSRRYDAPFEKY